jgi:hypothetical protein
MQSHELVRLRFQVEQQLSIRLQMVEEMLRNNVQQEGEQENDAGKNQLAQIEEYIRLVKKEVGDATQCCNGKLRRWCLAK